MRGSCTRAVVVSAALLWSSSLAAAGQAGFELRGPEVHGPLDVGQELSLEVELRNTGDTTWDPAEGFALSYHWWSDDGSLALWDGERSPVPRTLEPGEQALVPARVRTPARPGLYRLQWDVVQEGRRWLSEGADGVPMSPVLEVAHRRRFSLRAEAPPYKGWVSSVHRVPVTLCNTGTMDWPAGAPIFLAGHWLDLTGDTVIWEGARTPVPRELAAGSCVEMGAEVVFPARPGRYLMRWDMVEDGVCWFSERAPADARDVLALALPGPYLAPAALLWTILLLFPRPRRSEQREERSTARWPRELVWLAGLLWMLPWAVLDEAGLHPDAIAMLLALCGLAPLLLLLLCLSDRWRLVAVAVLALAGSLLVQADLLYFRFFSDLLPVAALAASAQGLQLGESVRSLLRPGDVWLWLHLPPALILLGWMAWRRVPTVVRGRRAVALGLSAAVLGGLILQTTTAGERTSVRQVFRTLDLARDLGVLNAHGVDLVRSLGVGLRSPQLSADEILAHFHATAPTRRAQGPLAGAAAGANLLMIQVESLQSFVLELEPGGRAVMPNLERWHRNGALLVDLVDQSAEGRSSDSEFLTQVSLLPAADGALAFRYPDNRYTGLAAVLGARAYTTLSAVPFDGSFWNRRRTHAAFGFAASDFVEDFGPGEAIGWGLSDPDFVAQMLPRLTRLPQPFYVWMITLSLHHPFTGFPEDHKELLLGEWENSPLGNYLHTMHYFDRALGELEAGLEAAGLLDDTLVVLWGDHDAGLEWTPELAALTGQPASPAGWYRSQKVPLLMRPPAGVELPARLELVAGQQDVGPTVLALLGVDPAEYAFIGRNLLGAPGGAPVIGEYRCWSDAEHLFLQGSEGFADGECRDRRSLERLPLELCRPGQERALHVLEVSDSVLVGDQQLELHRRLQSLAGAE